MTSLLSQFTFLDCLRLSVKRVLEFSPASPHPSNLGTEAQASTALAHGQAEALKKNKKTRENVCRDLKREETFCDSLDFTCNWKTTWGSFMACSAGCWDLYRSWWFSSRQGWVCLQHIRCTVHCIPYTSVNDRIHILATCLDASIVATVTTVNFSRVWPPLPAASSLWCVFWCGTKESSSCESWLRTLADSGPGFICFFHCFHATGCGHSDGKLLFPYSLGAQNG